jgi:hypothetical protein
MELTQAEALRAYARMINTLDVSPLEPLLADEFCYASQRVFDEINSKKDFFAYIKPKLRMIARGDSPVFAEMGLLCADYGGGPCVVMAQGTKDTLVGTVLAKTTAGSITLHGSTCVLCHRPRRPSVLSSPHYPTPAAFQEGGCCRNMPAIGYPPP